MMTIEIFTVDAFTRQLFKGNPAAICTSFRDRPPSAEHDILFQEIATEMNLSDTAFITQARQLPSSNRYFLQWFTPKNEVHLCGHATLAMAHVLFEHLLNDVSVDELIFETKTAGELKVKRCAKDGRLQLDFPAGNPQPVEFTKEILAELRVKLNIPSSTEILATQVCQSTKYLLVHLSNLDDQIRGQDSLMDIPFPEDIRPFICGIIVTSASTSFDFVSRFFAPWNGILEDPVTGSAHTVLAVYWSQQFHQEKTILRAYQQSTRGGDIECELSANRDRVFIRGSAVTVLQGHLRLNSFSNE